MPVYEFHCDVCARYQEEWQGMNDDHIAFCGKCGRAMDRVFSPAYLTGDLPQTRGTVMGYDETLGCEVRGQQHRKDLMEQKGLKQYEPDPLIAKYGAEARYIEKHDPGPVGRAAARTVRQKAGQERREQAVGSVMEAAFKE